MTPLERTTREVEGHLIVTSGSLVCPSPDLCDIRKGEGEVIDGRAPEKYVRRHARDHNLGDFKTREDAERNLGLWCFYFDHKYVWGNAELHPLPHWELHAFIAEWTWSETDLQSRIPLKKRKNKGYLLPSHLRRKGEYRRFKQCEVPRQCQKTSMGARAYSVFRAKHEYFVNARRNYRIVVRSATMTLPRETLEIIKRMSTKSQRLADLYGIWLLRCHMCGASEQSPKKLTKCSACGSEKRLRHKRLSLLNTTFGTGATKGEQLSFRWLTDSADAVAAYSVKGAGLKTETTGWRPDLYIWDDPQTEDNSDTVEKRTFIKAKFDSSWREKQFGGEMLVFNTRKYISDFGGSIQQEPLASLFHALRREVRWPTDEPDNPPWVVDGWRYYYPLRGDGQRALDAEEVRELRKQKNFSAEYMNDPIDEDAQTFKRSDFILVSRSEDPREWPEGQNAPLPVEIVAGLGRAITPPELREMESAGVRVNAMNAWDPADNKKSSADENFGVAVRLSRYGKVYVTKLSCGRWNAKRRWTEVEQASAYNMARFTDYEMGIEEDDIHASFEKWIRDRSDELTAAHGEVTMVVPPIRFERMPKQNKLFRIEDVQQYLPIYILDDAGSDDLIEKFIAQFVGLGVEDHDDGPDALSRLVKEFARSRRYEEPTEEEKATWVDPADGAAYVPLGMIKDIAGRKAPSGLWGERGRG